MMIDYYLLVIEGDIEPEVYGPYPSEGHRDLAARKYRIENGDDDGVYALDISSLTNKPVVSAYSGGFMDEHTLLAYVHLGCEFPTKPFGDWVQVCVIPTRFAETPEATEAYIKSLYESPTAYPFPKTVKKWGFVGEDFTIPNLEE